MGYIVATLTWRIAFCLVFPNPVNPSAACVCGLDVDLAVHSKAME